MNTRKLLFLSVLFIMTLISVLSGHVFEFEYAVGLNTSSSRHPTLVTDSIGNIYIAASFSPPINLGDITLTNGNIYIAKMDSNGNWLWAKTIEEQNEPFSISNDPIHLALDNQSNVLIAGSIMGTAYFDSFVSSEYSSNAFVAKLSPEGEWLWVARSSSLEGLATDLVSCLAVDGQGNSYISGMFNNAFQFGDVQSEAWPMFSLIKINSMGECEWILSSFDVFVNSMSVDSFDNVYACGNYEMGVPYIFIGKLDPSGNWLWDTSIGYGGLSYGEHIRVDSSGGVYVSGRISGNVSFGDIHLVVPELTGFIGQCNSSGEWSWVTTIECSTYNGISVTDLILDHSGGCVIAGSYAGNISFGSYSFEGDGHYNMLLAAIDSNGEWTWGESVGNGNLVRASKIDIDNNGDLHLLGRYSGDTFFGNEFLPSTGFYKAYIAKLKFLNTILIPEFTPTIVGDITLISDIDLVTVPEIGATTPAVLALPNFANLSNIQVLGLSGSGTGNLTVTVGPGLWFGLIYFGGQWHLSEPPSVEGPGILSFTGIDFDAKGDVIIVLSESEDPTLPVQLSAFDAELTAQNYVHLNWVSESETDLVGYRVYRHSSEVFADAVLVSALIPGTNSSTQHCYEYVDKEIYESGSYYYWLESSDLDGSSSIYGPVSVCVELQGEHPEVPGIELVTGLQKVFPNPFNPSTFVSYSLAEENPVSISIYNTRGQLVKNLSNCPGDIGLHQVYWDGRDSKGSYCSSGIYFIRMQAGRLNFLRKAILMK